MSGAPWRNPRVVITLVAIFLSGAAAGALTMKLTSAPHNRPPRWSEPGGREFTLHRLQKELDLSPQQEKEMEQVLDDFTMYYQTLQAQMEDVRATGKQRILRLLNEDQRQRFLKMTAGEPQTSHSAAPPAATSSSSR